MIRVAALVLSLSALSSSSAAQDVHRLTWSDDWSRVHPVSYGIIGAAIAATLFIDYGFDPGAEALVRGPAVFDSPWRSRLMAPAEEDRERAATLSDVLLGALLGWPWIDSLGVAGIGDQNTDVLWQMSAINAEAAALDLLLNTIAKQLVARERPHGERCYEPGQPHLPVRCAPRARLRSFYSGHASAAFTNAGLVCIHHAHIPLYGSPAADAMACGTALLTATIVATLRVVADRHHATDVVIGGLVGLAVGLLMPWALHYAWDPIEDEPPAVAPLGASRMMLSWSGSY
jgi:hypothetical protein